MPRHYFNGLFSCLDTVVGRRITYNAVSAMRCIVSDKSQQAGFELPVRYDTYRQHKYSLDENEWHFHTQCPLLPEKDFDQAGFVGLSVDRLCEFMRQT